MSVIDLAKRRQARVVTMDSPVVAQMRQSLHALDLAEERRLETQRGHAFVAEGLKLIINNDSLDAAVTHLLRRMQELKTCGE